MNKFPVPAAGEEIKALDDCSLIAVRGIQNIEVALVGLKESIRLIKIRHAQACQDDDHTLASLLTVIHQEAIEALNQLQQVADSCVCIRRITRAALSMLNGKGAA